MTAQTDAQIKSVFPFVTELRDGTRLSLRPVRSEDKQLLVDGMKALSADSKRWRFFHAIGEIPETLLRDLTEIDHVDHEAIGAFDVTDGAEQPVGIARYIRDRKSHGQAEVAITIVDDHQGRGLGTLLIAILARLAVTRGIEIFTAVVLSGNKRMLEVFREIGGTAAHQFGGETQITIPVFADPALYPETPAGEVFREVYLRLEAQCQTHRP